MIIKVDMDETICYLLKDWIGAYNHIHKDTISVVDIVDWDLFKYVKHPEGLKSILYNSALFENLQIVEGAKEALEDLNELHDIIIVSDAQGDESIITGKLRWLHKHLPFINCREQVIFTANKHLIKGDILIEDGPFILESDDPIKILIDRPYNKDYIDPRIKRYNTWKEIYEYIDTLTVSTWIKYLEINRPELIKRSCV